MVAGRLLALILLLFPAAGHATEIWLGALEGPWRDVRHWQKSDYMDLFLPDAQWPQVASHLTEIRLTKRFVLEAPDAMLAAVVHDLARRHVAIAMQMSPLRASRECGLGIEGYGPKDDAGRAAERLRAAGGVLDAVVMDEPVWFGHFFHGRNGHAACQLPINEMAQQAAVKIAQLRAVFPKVRVGEVEPVGDKVPVREFDQALVEWLTALRAATGTPPAFLQADVLWARPGWEDALRSFVAVAAQQGLPLGIIYNGSRSDESDAAWTASAHRNFLAVENRLGITPAIAAFESWTEYPVHLLPEAREDTQTGVVLSYLRFRKLVH
jgi:hypothetical protein